MTDEQINIAIAQACGIDIEKYLMEEGGINTSALPDYYNDLNAMHEAEKIFDTALYCRYINELCDLTINANNSMYMATARQRAEAFLKTVNKSEY